MAKIIIYAVTQGIQLLTKVKGFDSKHGGDQSTILDKSGTAFCYLQKLGQREGEHRVSCVY